MPLSFKTARQAQSGLLLALLLCLLDVKAVTLFECLSTSTGGQIAQRVQELHSITIAQSGLLFCFALLPKWLALLFCLA
jgi:hypothetical protein